MSKSTNEMPNEETWALCPEGELSALAGRLAAQDRKHKRIATTKLAGVVAAGCALLIVGIGLVRGPSHDPIDCRECIAHFDAFAEHLRGDKAMPRVTLAQVSAHMQVCQKCPQHFERKHPGLLTAAQTAAAPPQAAWLPVASLACR